MKAKQTLKAIKGIQDLKRERSKFAFKVGDLFKIPENKKLVVDKHGNGRILDYTQKGEPILIDIIVIQNIYSIWDSGTAAILFKQFKGLICLSKLQLKRMEEFLVK